MDKKTVIAKLKPDKKTIKTDMVAGLTFAIVNVPQGMANAVLATVNPVAGLYALMIAMPVGALLTSSVYMNVSTTGALSVAVGDALMGFDDERKLSVLAALVLMIGVFQLAMGLLKMGRLIRFVSNSVMTGFINGIAVLIILGAIPDLTGYTSPHSGQFFRLADTLINWRLIDPLTAVLGIATIVLILLFGLTRLAKFSLIIALALITLASVILSSIFGIKPPELVSDIASIPRMLPMPMLPDFSVIPSLLVPAFAIAVVGLVQGAGVGQAYPNPDGKYPDTSRDFTGQGVANATASFFQAIPCGGSMSGTAVSVQAGARSRWANIFAGLFVMIIVLLAADLVKLIPMAALGGLLVVVGFQNLRPKQILAVWHTNKIARAAMLLTLAATLSIPLQFAILVGVAVSILLHTFKTSTQTDVVEIAPVEGGYPVERPAPEKLSSGQVTVIHVRGSLFFASAAPLEEKLPDPREARRSVVVFNMRERSELGSTMIGVLSRYAESLQAVDGRLLFCGVSPSLQEQLDRTGMTEILGEESLFAEQPQYGAAMNEAVAFGRNWIKELEAQEAGAAGSPAPGTRDAEE